MAILEILNVIGGCITLITYGAVVRQKYVSLAVCMLSLLPPIITVCYYQLNWWEMLGNFVCLSAYATCLFREVLAQKSFWFVGVLIGASLLEGMITSYMLVFVSIPAANYCAFLAFCSVSAPAIGCYRMRRQFSYMDTYVSFLGAIGGLLSISPGSTLTIIVFSCLTSAIGLLYSLYAFYIKRTRVAHNDMDSLEIPDRSSTEAQFGSPTNRNYLDIFDRMESKKKDQLRGTERQKVL